MADKKLDPKATEKIKNNIKESQKAQQELYKFAKKFAEESGKGAKAQETLGEKLKQSAGFMAGLVGADKLKDWQGMVTKMVETNSELHRSIINAGKGAEALSTYKNAATQLSTELGATHEAANSVVKTLTEKQFLGTPDQISKAAKSTYALARAFGISEKTVADNTVELQKWGQVSADTTTAMYADVLKVAQANGLTKDGVQEVMKSTTKWSGMLKAFGKAPEDVKKYNMSLAKTVSALEKVGVSAQATTQMLDELTDPTRIEDNIPKYAALGISITDAITGNIDAEQMGAGLKEFGEKLKQMGPIAGAQYAKAMGVSYKDAIKAASADMAEASQVEMTPEEKAYDQLTKMTEKTKDMTEQFKDIVNKVGGMMRSFGPMFLTIAGTFLPIIMSNFKKRLKDDTGDAIKDGAKNGIDEGVKTSKERIADAIKDAVNGGFSKTDKSKYNLKEDKKEQTNGNIEKRKNLLAMMKKGLTAEQVFFEKKQAVQQKLNDLQAEYLDKRNKYDENKNMIFKYQLDITDAKNEKERDVLKARVEALKTMQVALGNEMENLDQRRTVAEIEKDIIKSDEGKLKNKLRYFENKKGGGVGEQSSKMAAVWSSKISGAVEKVAGKVAGFVTGIPGVLAKGAVSLAKVTGKGIAGAAKKVLGPKITTYIAAGAKTFVNVGARLGSGIANKLRSVKLKMAANPAIGKLIGGLGGLSIVMVIIGKVLGKLKEPLELILDNLIKELQPAFDALMPIIMLLGDLLGALVKFLMPPILKILSFLLKAIGMLAGVFKKEVGDAIKESANKMSAAADKIKNSEMDLNKSVEENTDAIKGKEKATVSGGKVMISKGNYEEASKQSSEGDQSNNSAATSNQSSSQVVNSINTANKSNEEMITYLKNLNEKFDILIAKTGDKGMSREEEEKLRSSIQAGFTYAIKNNVVMVKTEDGMRLGIPDTPGNAVGGS